ncbi:hypothetical protein MRX96_027819 [Rhipicephalus microplus]
MIVHRKDENASGKRDSRTVRGLVSCVFVHAQKYAASSANMGGGERARQLTRCRYLLAASPTDPPRQLTRRRYPLVALPPIRLGNWPAAATCLRLSGSPTDPARQLTHLRYPFAALSLISLGNIPATATRSRLSHRSGSATDPPPLPPRGSLTDPARQLTHLRYPLAALPLISLGNIPATATRSRLSHRSGSATDPPPLPARGSPTDPARQLTRLRYPPRGSPTDPARQLTRYRYLLAALPPIRLGNWLTSTTTSRLSH